MAGHVERPSPTTSTCNAGRGRSPKTSLGWHISSADVERTSSGYGSRGRAGTKLAYRFTHEPALAITTAGALDGRTAQKIQLIRDGVQYCSRSSGSLVLASFVVGYAGSALMSSATRYLARR